MNYYPFHMGDYASHTGHLDPLEDIAYRRMLDMYYIQEGPLPCDISEVARRIRMREYLPQVEIVLREFFALTSDGWRHYRCDDELVKMKEKKAKAQASAMASVAARKANAQRTFSERSTDVQLPTPTPTPINKYTTAPNGLDELFSKFWQAYPRKIGKDAARKAFAKRKPDESMLIAMLDALIWQTASEAWTKNDGQFIPHPATWLNQGRWQDEQDASDDDAYRSIFKASI